MTATEPMTVAAFVATLPAWVTADLLIRAALYLDPAREDEIARARAVSYAMAPETP